MVTVDSQAVSTSGNISEADGICYAHYEENLVRWGFAGNPKAPMAALNMMWNDDNDNVREELSQNPSLSPWALAKLSTDPELDIRMNVASHPNTDLHTLLLMWRADPHPDVVSLAGDTLCDRGAVCPTGLAATMLTIKGNRHRNKCLNRIRG